MWSEYFVSSATAFTLTALAHGWHGFSNLEHSSWRLWNDLWRRQPLVAALFCLPLFSYCFISVVSWGPPAAGLVAVTVLAYLKGRAKSICLLHKDVPLHKTVLSFSQQWACNFYQLLSDSMDMFWVVYRRDWKLDTNFSRIFLSHLVAFIKTCNFERKKIKKSENSV